VETPQNKASFLFDGVTQPP